MFKVCVNFKAAFAGVEFYGYVIVVDGLFLMKVKYFLNVILDVACDA